MSRATLYGIELWGALAWIKWSSRVGISDALDYAEGCAAKGWTTRVVAEGVVVFQVRGKQGKGQ